MWLVRLWDGCSSTVTGVMGGEEVGGEEVGYTRRYCTTAGAGRADLQLRPAAGEGQAIVHSVAST
jgi:hypothetical protein